LLDAAATTAGGGGARALYDDDVTDEARRKLAVIDAAVDARVRAIGEAHGDWPCRRGCSDCCRSLAAVPEMNATEWERLYAAYRALAPATQKAVGQRIAALPAPADAGGAGPITCPFLDRDEGACLVYAARPTACRTYGFYAHRDGGRWCHRIEAIANEPANERSALVWGNHAAIDADLAQAGGAPVPLTAWFAAGDSAKKTGP
jgi:uncharacterized protein